MIRATLQGYSTEFNEDDVLAQQNAAFDQQRSLLEQRRADQLVAQRQVDDDRQKRLVKLWAIGLIGSTVTIAALTTAVILIIRAAKKKGK